MADLKRLTIEITAGHCLGGEGNDVCAGQVLVAPRDLSIDEALKKVRMGYARIVPSEAEPGPGSERTPGPDAVTHGDPPVTHRDPEIEAPEAARRGRFRTGGRKSE